MKFVKIVVSLLLVVCLALPLSACNTKDTRWIARCGDEELAAGIFLILEYFPVPSCIFPRAVYNENKY